MSDPAFVGMCRALVAQPEAEREFGMTVVAPKGSSFKGTGIRPELLSQNMKGERVYRVTRKQAVKFLKTWDAHNAELTA